MFAELENIKKKRSLAWVNEHEEIMLGFLSERSRLDIRRNATPPPPSPLVRPKTGSDRPAFKFLP